MDTARDVFAEKGFHSTSMDDVAGRAGVTKPILYQHFESKRALYVEVLEDVGAQLLNHLAAATGNADGMRERVAEGFRAYFAFVAANRNAFRLLFGASVRNDDEFAVVVGRVLDSAGDAITTLVDVPLPPPQRRMIAHALMGMAEATSREAILTDDEDSLGPDELARWMSELAWFGLRGLRAGDAQAATGASATG